jgi:hypothetical protein
MWDYIGRRIINEAVHAVGYAAKHSARHAMHKVVNEAMDETYRTNYTSKVTEDAIDILINVPGMQMAHSRDFKRGYPIFTLSDSTVVRVWQNPQGVEHIFLADRYGRVIFGAFVDSVYAKELDIAITRIRTQYT